MKHRPMLVTSGPLRRDDDSYAFEVKWDGFRALIEADPSGIKIWSRNGHDMTPRYPELEGLTGAVKTSVFLDGEIVCLDDKGNPDFAGLWFRSRGSSSPAVCLMAFDVLEARGKELIDEPYRERRGILEELGVSGPHWCTPEIHIGEGEALFDATKEMGLEGVVAKRLDSVTDRGCDRGHGSRRSTSRRATSPCSVGCLRKSGDRIAAASSWVCVQKRASRWPASSNPATDASSSSSSRRLLDGSFDRCSNQAGYGKATTRSSAR